jgi:hypothetical protein
LLWSPALKILTPFALGAAQPAALTVVKLPFVNLQQIFGACNFRRKGIVELGFGLMGCLLWIELDGIVSLALDGCSHCGKILPDCHVIPLLRNFDEPDLICGFGLNNNKYYN